MLTRCPSCQAAFSITDQQLAIASGMVRCGVCEYVFDARLYLFDQKSEESKLAAEPTVNDQAAHAAKPRAVDKAAEADILSKFENTQEFKIEKLIQSKTDAATPKQTEAEPTPQVEESEVPKIIASQVSQLEHLEDETKRTSLLGSGFVFLLVAALALQTIAVVNSNLLPKSISQPLCVWLSCVKEIPRALDRIEILNRSIYTHPKVDQALLVSVTIINRAAFAQPYPTVQLSFLDLGGEVIATRTFSPNEYLKSNWQPNDLLQVGRPISLQLELVDFGEEVVGYSFDFL